MKKFLSILLTAVLLCCATLSAFAAPAADAPVMDGATLVTFGDSITALSTWPRSVAKSVNMHLYNEGIGGNTTEQARARFERDVLSRDPDFVTISFGTNDFYLQDGTNPRVSIARYKENLQYFIDQVKAIGGTPILMTPPFMAAEALGPNSMYPEGSCNLALDVFVNAMREVASSTGTHLIDIHAACDNGGYNTSTFLIADGLHLADQGNQVFTDTIVSYMKANFNQDPSAPRVTANDPPALESGSWTKSLISHEAKDWLVLFPGTLYVTENDDGSISFASTTGGWPEMHYSPDFSQMFYAPVENSVLTLDMELKNAANISLYFNGPTPTHEYTNTSIPLAPIIEAHCPSVRVNGHDISGNQDIRVSVPLSAVVPSQYILADGSALFSGVKMLVVGDADIPVTFNEFSVTTGSPEAPVCADDTSLLPTSLSQITNAEGKVEYVHEQIGSLVMARSAESDIAWPSVKVTSGKSIDLHKTPYLHLKMTTNGGSANGFLHYTDVYGNQGSVRLSELVNGTTADFDSNLDVTVDLASYIKTGGTITLDYYTLSVYGVVGASITWNTLATARDASNEYTPGDIDGNDQITTSDAMFTLQHALGIIALEGNALKAADYNGDGVINTADARDILRASLY